MSLKQVLDAGQRTFGAYPQLIKTDDRNWQMRWKTADCLVEVFSDSNGLLFQELHREAGDIITEFENLDVQQLESIFALYQDEKAA